MLSFWKVPVRRLPAAAEVNTNSLRVFLTKSLLCDEKLAVNAGQRVAALSLVESYSGLKPAASNSLV